MPYIFPTLNYGVLFFIFLINKNPTLVIGIASSTLRIGLNKEQCHTHQPTHNATTIKYKALNDRCLHANLVILTFHFQCLNCLGNQKEETTKAFLPIVSFFPLLLVANYKQIHSKVQRQNIKILLFLCPVNSFFFFIFSY